MYQGSILVDGVDGRAKVYTVCMILIEQRPL